MTATSPNICTLCATTKSKRWNGVRRGRTLCWPCYQREWNARQRAKRPKVYAWAGEQ